MLQKINLAFYYLFQYPIYKLLFAKIGSRSRLINTKVDGYNRISIGDKVYINTGGWLACVPLTGSNAATLSIGSGTYIGRFCHIYATAEITIGNKVLMADKVYIADNLHGHTDITLPVIDQPVQQTNPVAIGDGAWLGENVCIIGASVGKNAVIGANAVVTKDIPDYAVAVGAPAYIIKRFDNSLQQWRKTDKLGNFIA
jgi:acetyltransferase-like isoleucine patch superfamily enzyme